MQKTDKIQFAAGKTETKQYDLTVAAIYCQQYKLHKNEYSEMLVKSLVAIVIENGSEVHSRGHPTCWPTDRNKIPDLVFVFIMKNI